VLFSAKAEKLNNKSTSNNSRVVVMGFILPPVMADLDDRFLICHSSVTDRWLLVKMHIDFV
jgi:hypothetical protein